jgi:hypothetical protein
MIGSRIKVKKCRTWKPTAWIIICIFIFPAWLKSQAISVAGTWSLLLDATMLEAGAGSNFIEPIASATGQVLVDINPRSYGRTWSVYVHKQDTFWDSSLHLDIRRQPFTNISGGLSYFELTDIDQEFFYSTQRKKCNDIQIQFQLRGASVSLTPGTYSTTVVYTLVDL